MTLLLEEFNQTHLVGVGGLFVCLFVDFQGFGDGSTILVAPLRGLNQPLRSSGTGLAEPPQRPVILEGPGSSLGLHTFSILLMEIAELTSLFQKSSFWNQKHHRLKKQQI